MFSIGKGRRKQNFMFVILICFGIMIPARSDEIAEQVKFIADKWQDAVVTTRIVIEFRKSERKIERLATVVDPSGLMVMSLASIDPSAIGIFPSSVDIKVRDISIILPDDREIPAKIVLRDTDLDLALLRLVEKIETPMPSVSVSDEVMPELMDQIVMLSRLGSSANYATIASPGRIIGVITKPRILYVSDITPDMNGLGSPVFDTIGRIVGFVLLKIDKTGEVSPLDMMMGSALLNILPVILPAKEIAEVIKKAP